MTFKGPRVCKTLLSVRTIVQYFVTRQGDKFFEDAVKITDGMDVVVDDHERKRRIMNILISCLSSLMCSIKPRHCTKAARDKISREIKKTEVLVCAKCLPDATE